MSDRHQLLRAMPIFGGLKDDLLQEIASSAARVEVERGSYFLREGDDGKTVFVLEQGRVAIVKLWHGRDFVLSELHSGDCFGEMSLLDLGLRSASIRAEEDAVALELSASTILRLTRFDAEQCALLYMNMGRELARRLREADERLFRVQLGEPCGASYAFRTV